jgi:ribosomal protein S18 acetylase RimI-like enzyme
MRVGERLLEWAVERIAARGRHFARLDTVANNRALCRYYDERGFRPLGTVTLFAAMPLCHKGFRDPFPPL